MKSFAVIKRWNDNPNDFQVIEYFKSIIECQEFIRQQKISKDFKWEIAEYQ